MKLEKITHPMMAYMLLPWYLDTWEPVEDSCLRLYDKLANDVDNTFCCAETDSDIIKGIAIAFKDGDDLVIWQMNGVSPKSTELQHGAGQGGARI